MIEPGTKLLNRYEVLCELGRGGMGIVYRAHDPRLDRDVAIKVLLSRNSTEEKVARFRREAQIVAGMDHPSIVSIHDFGEFEGSPMFVMPLVRGESLRSMIAAQSLRMDDVLELGAQVAGALAYSHAHRVIHRDIKPENIIVSRQPDGSLRVRITDFGLAQVQVDSRLTQSGSMLGTLAYLSPEQAQHHPIEVTSDLYSLGVVLYECVVGRPPFVGSPAAIVYGIAHKSPESPTAMGLELDQNFESLILECLAKEPSDRPQSGLDLAQRLQALTEGFAEGDESWPKFVASTAAQSTTDGEFPLFGREDELADLEARLEEVEAGECRFVLIEGEEGIGKSRLVEEIRKQAARRQWVYLKGRFGEQDRAPSYQGFCDFIESYFRSRELSRSIDMTDLTKPLVRLFPNLEEIAQFRASSSSMASGQRTRFELPVLPAEVTVKADRAKVFELLARALMRISDGRPTLLVLDQLERAEESIAALQYIVRRLGNTRTLLLGSCRSKAPTSPSPLGSLRESFAGDPLLRTLVVGPLSPAAHRQLICALTGAEEVTGSLAERLFELTEGNPLFTRELIGSLLASQEIESRTTGSLTLPRGPELSMSSLPQSVREAVEHRLDRLTVQHRDLLSVASVLGRTFEISDLQALVSDDLASVQSVTQALIRLRLLDARGPDRLRFRSALVYELLLESLSRDRRRELHLEFTKVLAAGQESAHQSADDRLAHHCFEAREFLASAEHYYSFAQSCLRERRTADARRASCRGLEAMVELVDDSANRSPSEEVVLLKAKLTAITGEAEFAIGNYAACIEQDKVAFELFLAQRLVRRALEVLARLSEATWRIRRVEDARHYIELGLDLTTKTEDRTTRLPFLKLGATVANLRGLHQLAQEYLAEAFSLEPALKSGTIDLPHGGILQVALPIELVIEHPVEMRLVEDEEVFANVFETLLRQGENGAVLPNLCRRWSVSDRATTISLQLRDDVSFHDGTELTATSVKESFELAIRRSSEVLPPALEMLSGARRFRLGHSPEVGGIKVSDRQLLQLELTEPLPIYPAFLTDARTAIVRSSATLDDQESHWDLHGTGPYVFENRGSNSIRLRANLQHWSHSPRLDGIDFEQKTSNQSAAAGLRSGRFDLAWDLGAEDLEELLRDRRFRGGLVESEQQSTAFVLFNRFGRACASERFRRAFCRVVRIDDIVYRCLGRYASPAQGLLPPGILGHDAARRRQPIGQQDARRLMMEAGIEAPLRLAAIVHPVFLERQRSILDALISAWAEIGVEIAIETSSREEFMARALGSSQGIDLVVSRWIPDYGDPDAFFYSLFHSLVGRWRNYCSWPEIDRLIESARTTEDPEKRQRLYRQLEQLMLNKHLILPLFHEVNFRLVGPRVQGLELRPSAPTVNYEQLAKSKSLRTRKPASSPGSVPRIAMVEAARTLDPMMFLESNWQVSPLLFQSLTRADDNARIEPWLASRFESNPESTKFSFRLRRSIRFHDGRQVGARDVRFSFERLLTHRHSTGRWLLAPVVGADALLSGASKELEGFRIRSPKEFEIELAHPVAFFPAILTSVPIVAEGCGEIGSSWREGCVGTGPFRVTRFESLHHLEVEGNPFYWRSGLPRTDRLLILFGVPPKEIAQGLEDGEFSLNRDGISAETVAESRAGLRVHEMPRLSTIFLAMNAKSGPLAELETRRLLVSCLDREELVRLTLGKRAIAARSLIPPDLLDFEPGRLMIPRQQLDRPVKIRLMILSAFDTLYQSFLEELLRTLRASGFDPEIVSARHDDVGALTSQPVDLVLSRWIADYPDPDSFVHGVLHQSQGDVGVLCGSDHLDRLIESGRRSAGSARRREVYLQVEDTLARECLMYPLFHEQVICVSRPEVHDLRLVLSEPVIDYERLRFESD